MDTPHAFLEGLTLSQSRSLLDSVILNADQRAVLEQLLRSIRDEDALLVTPMITDFFDSLTVAQCRFMRSTVLCTSEQRAAFDSIVFGADGSDDSSTPHTAAACSAASLPTAASQPVKPTATAAMIHRVHVHGHLVGLVHPTRFWDMPANATFYDFRTYFQQLFPGLRQAYELHLNMDMLHRMSWIEPARGRMEYVNLYNWDKIRDAWVQRDAVLHMDLRPPPPLCELGLSPTHQECALGFF